jgi:hypothetical protein
VGVGGAFAVFESRGPEPDVVLKAEEGVEVAEVDTGKESKELVKKLSHEEVELPAGGFEEFGGDAKEEAVGVFVKELQAG